jgi:DNA-binding NarL/FixJ family response regulator
VKYRFILELLDNDIEKAKKIYGDLLFESLRVKMASALENHSALRMLRKTLLPIFSRINKPIIKNNILDDVLLEKKIKELSQAKRLKNPEDIKARQYLVQQLLSRDFGLEEIAKKFNLSHRTVYDIISKIPKSS